MKTRILLIAVGLLCVFALPSCKRTPKIDGSSDEALKESVETLKASLSEDKKEKFEKAVMALALDGSSLFEIARDPDGVKRRLRDRLNGKSAEEIIEAAQRIHLERAEAQGD